jgi:hypothetical protein
MTYAIYCRHNLFFDKKFSTEKLFLRDILYGISLIYLMPAINIIGGTPALSFTYLAGSIVALLFYNRNLFGLNLVNLKQ